MLDAGRARHPLEAADLNDHSPIRVLFVCTGNSARSLIAEALLRSHGGSDFDVFSAGVAPKGINPFTLRVLGEAGISTAGLHSKSVDDYLDEPFDYVITVCDRARQSCPVFPGRHNALHWGLDDPAEAEGTEAQKLAAFRRTTTEVTARLRPFIELARRAHRAPGAVAPA
jgi:arsenate reductase